MSNLKRMLSSMINKINNKVASVNGIAPDAEGNVVVEIPEIEFTTDEEVLAMLAELGALPVAADSDGAVIVDANGTIVM